MRLRRDQRGITSLMITMLLIVISSLIVLSFAQIARREQRTALDNQLSSQAFYAAESGINDAKQLINTALSAGSALPVDPNCDNETNPGADRVKATLSATVRYTCLTINPTPKDLNGVITSQKSTAFHIKGSTNLGAGGLKITWTRSNTEGSVSDCPSDNTIDQFVPAGNPEAGSPSEWDCPFGVLRFDMTQVDGIALTGDALAAATETAFVLPISAGGSSPSIAYGYNHGNRVVATTCNNTSCTAVIGSLFAKEYYLNLRLVYGAQSSVTITRADGQPFLDSQVQIDATGKAQDVLRRLRVSINISGDKGGADAALAVGDGPCKRQFLSLDSSPTPQYVYSDTCPGEIGGVGANIPPPVVPPPDPPPVPPSGTPPTCSVIAAATGRINRPFSYKIRVVNNDASPLSGLTATGLLERTSGPRQTASSTSGLFNVASSSVHDVDMQVMVPGTYGLGNGRITGTVNQGATSIASCTSSLIHFSF